ncbi:MAG: Ig-like domain-containing protein, partial [Pirellula sp.]
SSNSTGILTFKPNLNRYGSAVITVTVMDGGLDGDLNTILDNAVTQRSFIVTVRPLNDSPAVNPIPNQYVLKSGAQQQFSITGISPGPFEDQPLRIQAVGGQSLLEILSVAYTAGSDTATITYKPLAERLGSTKITVLLEDSGLDGDLNSTSDNAITAVQFTITVYTPPVGRPDSAITTYDASVNIPVLQNDSDEDGFVVSGSIQIETSPSNGVLTVNPNGTINYLPSASFRGLDTFAYTVADDNGYRSNPATVQVRVVTSFYQNYRNRYDVDNDSTVSPLDVLVLINDINAFGTRVLANDTFTPPPYIDVNGDRRVDPLDVLEVINYLNSSKNGEGESARDSVALQLASDAATTDHVLAALYFDDALDPLTGRTKKRGI